MADEPKVFQDGYVSYAGGCHAAAKNARELADNQLAHIVNGTVRGSFLTPRDGVAQVQLEFQSAEDRTIFETGRFQGEDFYGETERIVYVIDGRIFSVDPISGTVSRHNAGGSKQPFSKEQEFAFLKERDGYMVIGDGINRTVILEKYAARRMDPNRYRDDTSKGLEIPIGTVMADGWGRLMVAGPDGLRVRFSDHELDPSSKSYRFTEETDYYLAARFFQPPRRCGPVMAAEFVPFVDAPTGLGVLLVLCKRASVTYDISLPRVDGGWLKTNIERMTLPNIGTCGHRSVMAVDNDVIFRDQYGRLRTLSQTVQAQELRKNSQRVRRFDREVSPWIKRETPWLREWSDVVAFDDRYLFTVLPDSTILPDGRRDVWHRGMLVYNLDVLANLRGQEDPAWDGLVTGLRVQALTNGLFDGEPRLFMLSRDSDGIRRLYEQRPGLTHDIARCNKKKRLARKAIEWQAGTRWLDFKSPFITKTMNAADLRIGEIRGAVKIEAFVRKVEGAEFIPWFTHNAGAADCLQMGYGDCGECGLTECETGDIERLPLPALPKQVETFYRIQFMLRITGWCELREFLIEGVAQQTAPANSSVSAKKLGALSRKAAVPWDDLTYDTLAAPEETSQ